MSQMTCFNRTVAVLTVLDFFYNHANFYAVSKPQILPQTYLSINATNVISLLPHIRSASLDTFDWTKDGRWGFPICLTCRVV